MAEDFELRTGFQPLVSVLICVYNGEIFLGQTIESVLSQTYQNIEVLIINDGSSDRSSSIIDKWAAKDSRIKCFNRNNSGLAESRNFGFRHASGEWIAIIDQDDLCFPARIERQLAVATQYPDAGVIFCETLFINAENTGVGSNLVRFDLPKAYIPKVRSGILLLTLGCFLDSEAFFFKRSLAEKVSPLDSTLTYCCDYEYFIRLGFETSFAYTAETLVAWRIHPNQESQNSRLMYSEYRNVLGRYTLDRRLCLTSRIFLIRNIVRSFCGQFYRYLTRRWKIVSTYS